MPISDPTPVMDSNETRRYYIKTFGCQMNDYDSERVEALLQEQHFQPAVSAESADLILLNTCSVRQKAADKIYSELGRLKKLKHTNPRLLIGVGGCLAQHEPDKLLKQFPCIDLLYGTQALARLPGLIRSAIDGKRAVDVALDAAQTTYTRLPRRIPAPGQTSAFVSIMQGCNNYCTYCIVPYVRGPEWSRTHADILAEIKHLIHAGVRDITLLGQNVNSYGKTLNPPAVFADLLHRLNALEGLERLRFVTSHPRDLSDALIACFGKLEKLCEHIHLPLQSGSDRILRAMNRSYTSAHYAGLIEKLRHACPDICITSDIIVGFPGETEEDFIMTRDFVERISFDDLFIFHYTDRNGTRACSMADKIPYSIKIQRLHDLNTLQRCISKKRNEQLVGKTLEILFERPSSRGNGCFAGRTRSNKVVNCPALIDLTGKSAPVIIRKASIHSLTGTLIQGQDQHD
jgi:tRNA-2-methylthio-N6-dimethylallyladenosine synthase